MEYRTRLNASIDCVRFLLRQGLAFRGHDESESSSSQGNFLELLKFLAEHNEDVKSVALNNARQNLKLVAPKIQKDIVSVAASETINVIIKDLGDALFSILIDEARDISIKEQMAFVIRYVNKEGHVIERFLGIEHVTNTSALALKKAVEDLFCRHGLSISRLRGQGYDGASNMQVELNGLKALILKESPCAYYVHCFAHQLQLALVAVAKNHDQIALLFNLVSNVVNVVGASCKRRDILKEKQASKVVEALNKGILSSGQGLNQETNLKRAGDTRWGSHYGTLISLIDMFSAVIDVLEMISEDGSNSEQRAEANVLLHSIQSFGFVFNLHLMRAILGITNELSQALQRKDQDIVNAMTLVQVSKRRLQMMRESGWSDLLAKVLIFSMNIVKNRLRNRMGDEWMKNSLIVAGAAAASGLSLADVAAEAKHASEMVGTMGVALSVCTLPGQVTSDRLGPGKMELGLGIHGEPGAAVADLQPVDNVVSHVLKQILSPVWHFDGCASS
ncbi:dihydroxyacetone kinase [Actinidia rufa]|uniref:Dihydroxyacetone kinase n=1 Tax=Actinidia rufa TaxID=165716 RepID=A0A7J0F9G5_9ERIC|nr:dihydroxyacetone kinase [Actinidia rufa]